MTATATMEKLLIAVSCLCLVTARQIPDARPRENVPTAHRNDDKIIGGQETSALEFPWQAAIYRDESFICGGSIIGLKYILTAAHCVDKFEASPSRFLVHVGRTDFASGGQTLRVIKINKNPAYDANTYDNDVATVELEGAVMLDERVQIVNMAESDGSSYSGYIGSVSGWGMTSEDGPVSRTLKYVDVPIISNSKCNDAFHYNGAITEAMMCAGKEEGGEDACTYDSGGPLVVNRSHDATLVGVVSWSYGCARPKTPGVYARVSVLRRWIDENSR